MSFPNFKKPSHILATWFGIGMLRPAPGTWGSLAAVTSWYFLEILHPWAWIIIPVFILLAWRVCESANEDSESNDHSSIVIDEVAGMLVALAFVEHDLLIYVFVFFLFRLFDIWKPWPISWVDKNIKGGWGILFDDLIAGLFAGAIILALISLI
jgi:phosphatidylglycerophosphatase A|tara:strand:- start:623 stop:1084 length:462 start_codon:yes stop_codon:yes gene_type:complete